MIDAIVFDFDGTILETETPDYISWREVYQEHQCELPLAVWQEFVGTSSAGFNPYEYLETLAGISLDRQAVRDLRRQRFHELLEQETLLPGVEAALTFAKDAGIRLAVASSSSSAWVTGFLEKFDVLHYFDTLCTSDDVIQVKPDPALYLLTLARLGITATEALAVEDSRNGMLAAKRAGLRCMVVPNAITRHSTFAEADMHFVSLADVDWPQLCQFS